MRDENGFKMHTQSESHVRQMLLVGEDAKKYINDYSSQFQRDFLQLLRTAHGEKQVHMNHFYQEYIANKEHVHMNATKWPSLTEFAKFLGREGICRVEDTEKGLQIAWIDNSPEALRRQDAIRKKERQDRGDEEREQMLIREQVRRAKSDAEAREQEDLADEGRQLKRAEGEKVVLSFGAKTERPKPNASQAVTPKALQDPPETKDAAKADSEGAAQSEDNEAAVGGAEGSSGPLSTMKPVSMKLDFSAKPKNVFAAAKKNVFGGKKAAIIEQPKKMSEAERIMREELERKQKRNGSGFEGPGPKRTRF